MRSIFESSLLIELNHFENKVARNASDGHNGTRSSRRSRVAVLAISRLRVCHQKKKKIWDCFCLTVVPGHRTVNGWRRVNKNVASVCCAACDNRRSYCVCVHVCGYRSRLSRGGPCDAHVTWGIARLTRLARRTERGPGNPVRWWTLGLTSRDAAEAFSCATKWRGKWARWCGTISWRHNASGRFDPFGLGGDWFDNCVMKKQIVRRRLANGLF